MKKLVILVGFLITISFLFSDPFEFLTEYEKNTMKISIDGVQVDYPLLWFEKFDPDVFERLFEAEVAQILNPCEYILEVDLESNLKSVERFELIGLKCGRKFDLDLLENLLPKGKKVYISYDPISEDGRVYLWVRNMGRFILMNVVFMMNGYAEFDENQEFLYKRKFEKLDELLEDLESEP